MAQKITVSFIDDTDGTEATETVEFALDGVIYEIDLSQANAAQLRERVGTWVSHGRRLGGRKKTGTQPSSQAGRGESRAVRAWAQENGFEISARGRINLEVLEAYREAH